MLSAFSSRLSALKADGRTLKAILAALAMVVSAAAGIACRSAAADPSPGPTRLTDIHIGRDSEIIRAIVPASTTLASLVQGHQVVTHETAALVESVAQHFDLRRLRAGQLYRIDRFLDGRIREFEYEIDAGRRLIARRLELAGAAFHTQLAEIPKKVDRITVEGEISRATPSLIAALDASGERLELSLALADIFGGEVDFNSDLQPGDRFRLTVERGTREDGLFGGYGPILAAELTNAGRPLRAVRFEVPGEKPGYYDEQGRSLERFLLKSPLKFDPRVTSGFSRARRHPILNYTRAHNGVDYAAPSGAPVAAVSGGIVTAAGWSGGGGRTVKLRHSGGYESEYLHLSSIAPGMRAGASVAQGDLIGRVGSTGLATGPHLHYGLRRNGAYVNPVREHLNMPPGEPVPALHLVAFSAARDRLFDALQSDARVRATND